MHKTDDFEPIHARIEAQARLRPDYVACKHKSSQLTYAELNQKANDLAYWLIGRGVRAGKTVGVCFPPCLESSIALLAIQKAGGVYVPIDPEYPEDRIDVIVQDAQPEIVLCSQEVLESKPKVFADAVAYQHTQSLSERNGNPDISVGKKDPCYIFYTSGTTGKPKGISLSYGNLFFYIDAAVNAFAISENDIAISIARFSFSISLFDLLSVNSVGGTLWVLSRDEVMNLEFLADAFSEATIAHIGPNLLRGLLNYIMGTSVPQEKYAGLRHLSMGGDYTPVDLLHELTDYFSNSEIYVIYGSSEIGCMGTYFPVPKNPEKSYVGKPFPGVSIRLLNDNGDIAADGSVGEICYNTPGLMLGYLNDEEKTRESMIEIEGETYFRIGDVGRFSPEGNLEHLGRSDFQVKIRGQRVELLELDQHLKKTPGVTSGICAAAGERTEKQLIAYVTVENREVFSVIEAQSYLEQLVPDYMLPSGWIILDKLPLNENMKLDRKALPAPTLQNLERSASYSPPTTELETKLTDTWAKALGHPRIGIRDNFFAVGGDSLSAMSISLMLMAEGLEISPLQIAENPTIEQLAGLTQSLELTEAPERALQTVALPPFISRFIQERGSQSPNRWNISRLVTVESHLKPDIAEKAFIALATRHDAMRLRLFKDGTEWKAESLADVEGGIHFEFDDVGDRSEQDQRKRIEDVAASCQAKINLAEGPVACIALFDLGKDRPQEMFFTVHHFVMDVVSWGIFWLEFESTYRQLEANTYPYRIAPSFAEWCNGLADVANSDEVLAAATAWAEIEGNSLPSLPEDFDYESSDNTNSSARLVVKTCSEEDTTNLLQSAAQGIDIEKILVAALSNALSSWSGGEESVYFDHLVHGRDVKVPNVDESLMLGCTVTYAPRLMQVRKGLAGRDLLDDISRQMEANAKQNVYFDLYRYLGANSQLVAHLNELPKAGILFNYRGKTDNAIEKSKVFGNAVELKGLDHDPDGMRQYPISLVSDVVDDKLIVRFVYSEKIHRQETIEKLAMGFMGYLNQILSEPY